MTSQNNPSAVFSVGDTLTLAPDRLAHGGSTVARAQGRVFFVRHALLGETVEAKITGIGPKNRFYFADTLAVKDSSADRRQHPWAAADALLSAQKQVQPVGGMEFGHIMPEVQREYKRAVIVEQLERLGAMNPQDPVLQELQVQAASAEELGQRTRIHFAVSDEGKIAMFAHQSDQARQIENFPLAHPALEELDLAKLDLHGISRVDAAVSSTGQRFLQFTTSAGKTPASLEKTLRKQLEDHWGDFLAQKISVKITSQPVSGRRRGERPQDILWGTSDLTETFTLNGEHFTFEVDGRGFWQNHVKAPALLSHKVKELAQIEPGESVVDLYAGAGLFTAIAADAVGAHGYVLSVEGSPLTSANAEKNFAEAGISRTERSQNTRIDVVRGDVLQVLQKFPQQRRFKRAQEADVLILDPSREGAGKKVLEQISAIGPRVLIYVACDPAALGRDCGYLKDLGWELTRAEGLDIYPNTHHVETIARFEPKSS